MNIILKYVKYSEICSEIYKYVQYKNISTCSRNRRKILYKTF